MELVKAIREPKPIGMNMLNVADLAQNFRASGNILPFSAISFPISLEKKRIFGGKVVLNNVLPSFSPVAGTPPPNIQARFSEPETVGKSLSEQIFRNF